MTALSPSRRAVLQILAGAAALAFGGAPAGANESIKKCARIARLIEKAQALPAVSQRIDFISRALIGSPYRGYTLIGGPRQPEQFVVRDDVFDCVTFCETVLAAALVREPDRFAAMLRQIRYRDGSVAWSERNHYFADWCANNTAGGICRPLALPGCETKTKTVSYMPALGARPVSLKAIPSTSLLANKERLTTGDIIGFLSERPRLDYFHIGFVVVADDGKLWLRHAAKSRHRVLDQPLARFLRHNRVRAVTLLRPLQAMNDDTIV